MFVAIFSISRISVPGRISLTRTISTFTLNEIIAYIGQSKNLVNIINNLVGGLIFKDETTGDEANATQLLKDTFFADFVAYAVIIGEQNKNKTYLEAKVIAEGGAFGGLEGTIIRIDSTKYDATSDNEYYELTGKSYNVVNTFSVDIADSLVFILENVLTKELLAALVPADKRVDADNKTNLIGMILGNIDALIDGEIAGLTLLDVIVALFEGYEISYKEYNTIPDFVINHDGDIEAEELPGKLDTIINEALPLVLTLLVKGDAEEGSILDIIKKSVASELSENETRIEALVDDIINGFVIEGDLDIMNLIVNLVVDLLGGTAIIDTILGMIKIGDYKLTAADFKASINDHFAGKAEYATAVAAVNGIIGDAQTWAEVKENAAKGEDGKCAIEAEWGVDSLDTLINAILVLVQPLTPVLQVLFQGKNLTLLSSNGVYAGDFDADVEGAKDNDDRDEEIESGVILGDGYLEIRGSKGYEQGILALVDALNLNVAGISSVEAYNASNDIEVVLGDILKVVLALVDGIAAGPITFIAEHLAGLLYFVAADNLAVLVNNIIALVWGLLAVVEPITGETNAFIESLLGVNLDNYITINGLLNLINGLIAGNKELEVTEVDGKLVAVDGEKTYEVAADAEIRTDAETGKQYATVKTGTLDLVITVDMLKTLIAEIGEAKDDIGISKTPVKGSKKYFVNGLLTFAVETVLPLFVTEDENAIINQIITYLSADGAIAGVINFLNTLTTKYVVDFFAIEDPEVALQKIAVKYATANKEQGERLVSKAEADQALKNLDALVAKLLPMLGVLGEGETLATFVSGLLLNDKMASTIVGLLAGVFSGLNADIMDIIKIVGDALGEKVDVSVETYKQDADIAGFFGTATTWAEVAELYRVTTVTEVESEDGTETVETSEIVYEYDWGIDALESTDAKIERFVAILTSFLAPIDFVLEVLLAGGTNDGNAENADSISAFKEINIMGGSGYNYAIIPLMEALGVPANMIKTQAEYEATFNAQGTLGYILETVLKYVVAGLNAPVDFVLGLLGNLAYTISKADINIRMIDQGSSEINIIIGVEDGDFEKAIRAIYDEFMGEAK